MLIVALCRSESAREKPDARIVEEADRGVAKDTPHLPASGYLALFAAGKVFAAPAILV